MKKVLFWLGVVFLVILSLLSCAVFSSPLVFGGEREPEPVVNCVLKYDEGWYLAGTVKVVGGVQVCVLTGEEHSRPGEKIILEWKRDGY